jgi:spore coat protein U-like protein
VRAALAGLFCAAVVAASPEWVTATTCRFNAGYPAPMTFGNFDTISGSSVTATTTIQYNCGHPLPANVTMSADGGLNGTVSARAMKEIGGTGDLLPYTLSLNASYSPVFGDGTSGTQTYSATVRTTSTVTVTIYGIINAAIPGGAGDVHAGSYSDTVTITMTF